MPVSDNTDFSSRRWPDFEDISPETVGCFVDFKHASLLLTPPDRIVLQFLLAFFEQLGLPVEEATATQIGSASTGDGGQIEVFDLIKPITLSITVVKFLLSWKARYSALKRRRLLPKVSVVLLADHIAPVTETATSAHDSAKLLISVLPEMQRAMEVEFPQFNFEYEIRAQGRLIKTVIVSAGNGLTVTDSNVLKMLLKLNQEIPSITLRQREGWFALPAVFEIRMMALPARQFSGRQWNLGR